MAALNGYLALGVLSAAGVFTEISGATGYARQPISLQAASAGAVQNASAINFPLNSGTDRWPAFGAYAVYDAATGGTPTFAWGIYPGSGSIPSRSPLPGRRHTIPAGTIKLEFPTAMSEAGSEVVLSKPFLWTPGGLQKPEEAPLTIGSVSRGVGEWIGDSTRLQRLRRVALQARYNNPRTKGVMASPPTVTLDGASAPAGQTNAYTYAAKPGVFRVSGGQVITGVNSSVNGRVRSSIIAATGGNLSLSDGSTGTLSRWEFMADSAKVTISVGGSTVPFRFLVNDQYVNLTGTSTLLSANATEYISLDFSGIGGRARRKITLEMQQNQRCVGVYVGATESVEQSSGVDLIRSVLLGDSYANSAGATIMGDGFGFVMADYLGIRAHSNTASSGTGWAAVTANYRFDQRIVNGDLLLGGLPDIIFLMGSYNDRGSSAATITANALTGLRTARAQCPNAPIFVFGNFAGGSGPDALSLASENAVAAAVSAFGDPLCKFIPVSTDANGAWISGTGKEGTTLGSGNSDIYTGPDGVHPTQAGHAYIGQRCADAVLATLEALF